MSRTAQKAQCLLIATLYRKGEDLKIVKRIIRKIIRNTLIKLQAPEPRILNESVNFEKQYIFIAVPKAGTTSVRLQLRQKGIQLIKTPHLNIIQIRDSLYVYFLKQNLKRNKTFPSEQVPSDADLHIKAKEVFNTFFKFAAVRNPWARAVSLYSRRSIQIKGKISFEDFCKNHLYASDTCLHPTLHQNQLDWLCDENGQCIMDYVYKLENFYQATKEIAERTNGRLQIVAREVNYNPNSNSRSYRDLYTGETRKMIAKRFEKDIDTFKYTF